MHHIPGFVMRTGKKLLIFHLLILVCIGQVRSQGSNTAFLNHLNAHISQKNVSDYAEYTITNQHISRRSRVTHSYLNQTYNSIRIFNAVMSIHITADGKLLTLHDQFFQDLQSVRPASEPQLSQVEIVRKIAQTLNLQLKDSLSLVENISERDKYVILSKGGISQENIPVRLIYFPQDEQSLILSWETYIHETEDAHWWHIIADAGSGAILYKENLYINCTFGEAHVHHAGCISESSDFESTYEHIHEKAMFSPSATTQTDVYNVFPLGIESPSHGGRVLVINPADPAASPFGWHDTNGQPGAEHTTTKGNNVEAREDIDGNNNTLGNMAQGGNDLIFDYPINFTLAPAQSQNAAITNLFYWNNIMHDIWYQYGFDESAGNFQQNNYGNGGLANDFVRADALDGSGTNNANFATPVDGSNPRMQMFLWTGNSGTNFTATAPSSVAGTYSVVKAAFGAQAFNVNGQVVIASDGTANPTLACNALTNSAAMNGKIALIDRGSCEFGVKCLNAQNAGAIAVIVCNNVTDNPTSMGAGAVGNQVTIPCVMISQANCNTLRVTIPNLFISMSSTGGVQIDGDYDNGVIAHEYGHGISIRLTGGAGNSSCLNNQEQMGEGWSDWFGLMLTIKPEDNDVTPRGIGTYVINQPPTGNGIRSYPYSTSMTVNPHTYDVIKTIAAPHGVGSVWCAMLWELTWNLIKEYGYDPDLYNGTGGNNIAMALVTEALKLQPCSPGFVSGRDAILLADQALYGGRNRCIIWEAFAKRGLGFSAVQGSTSSKTDGTQAFDMPASCCTYVMNTQDSGDRSIRTAVQCAAPGDTIRFSPNIQGQMVNLTSGALTINKNLVFEATNADKINISSSTAASTFIINEGADVQMIKMNVKAGNGTDGRAIVNNGTLTLKDVIVNDTPSVPANSTVINNGTLNIYGNTNIKNQ